MAVLNPSLALSCSFSFSVFSSTAFLMSVTFAATASTFASTWAVSLVSSSVFAAVILPSRSLVTSVFASLILVSTSDVS